MDQEESQIPRIVGLLEEGRRSLDERMKYFANSLPLQGDLGTRVFRGDMERGADRKLALSLEEEREKRLMDLLFPNRTTSAFPFRRQTHSHDTARDLKEVYDPAHPVVCIKCQNMVSCPALNNFQIQEIYLPNNLEQHGTCTVLDQLGKIIQSEIFGPSKTFRKDPQCMEIVMEYLCLFWGSNSDQYTNYCVFQEDVSDPNPLNHRVAPRPPCRSFCTQIATICANDPLFVNQCNKIACPPFEDSCTPDPSLQGLVFAANLGCALPLEQNPYVIKKNIPNAASRAAVFNGLLPSLLLIIVTVLLCFR